MQMSLAEISNSLYHLKIHLNSPYVIYYYIFMVSLY